MPDVDDRVLVLSPATMHQPEKQTPRPSLTAPQNPSGGRWPGEGACHRRSPPRQNSSGGTARRANEPPESSPRCRLKETFWAPAAKVLKKGPNLFHNSPRSLAASILRSRCRSYSGRSSAMRRSRISSIPSESYM
jgi:hypothetical protein